MNRVVANWYRQGRPVTDKGVPHEVKANVIQEQAATFGLRTFVETGTCHGAMIQAVASDFDIIYTIEMHEPNYDIACERLAEFSHVTCLWGDSAEWLDEIVPKLTGPALFFLDAHYSGGGTARGAIDTPIVQELEILARSEFANVIIIDDARLFEGQAYHTEEFKDYPSLEWIRTFVTENFNQPSAVLHIADEFVILPL